MPWILFAVVVALPVVGGIFLRPVAYRVTRSARIDKPVGEVFAAVDNLEGWPQWSPWLYVEPGAKVEVRGDGRTVGSSYSWEGELVGKGEIEIVRIDAPTGLELEIRFEKPFKSKAQVTFSFGEKEGETEVTWSMNGRIPIAMRKTMVAWIGMDYERGLAMLKALVESGRVASATEIVGAVERPELHFVGVERSCELDRIGEDMDQAFSGLEAKLAEFGVEPTGPSLCVYEEYDLVTGECDYVAGVPVAPESLPEGLPDDFIQATLPAHRAFEVVHTGPLDFLANGWATGFQHVRHRKLPQRKGMYPYEIYARAPRNTPADEVRTEIFFPIK